MPIIIDESGARNRIFGYPESVKNGSKPSWTRLFFIFWHIWWFFKVSQCLRCTPLWKVINRYAVCQIFGKKMKQILVQPALPKPRFRDQQAKILNLAAKISTYLFSYILFTILYVGQSLVSKSKNEVETNKIYKFKKSSSCCCQFLIMKYSLGFFLKDKQGVFFTHTLIQKE